MSLSSEQTAPAAIITDGNAAPASKKIAIVVDDEALLLGASKEFLTRLGYYVITCHSAEKALNVFRDLRAAGKEISLIFTDIEMSVMTGIDLLKDPTIATYNCAKLLASARIENYSNDICLLATSGKLDYWLSKPYSLADFGKRVTSAEESAARRSEASR